MTNSIYNKQREWNSGYVNRPFSNLLSNTVPGAKRNAQGAFSIRGLDKVSRSNNDSGTIQSITDQMLDNFIQNSWNEYQEFYNQYHKRKHARLRRYPPYTPLTEEDYL